MSKNEIEIYLKQKISSTSYDIKDVFEQTKLQLKKDFDSLQIKININEINQFNSLFEIVHCKVKTLLMYNFETLLNLMYRIDVDQEKAILNISKNIKQLTKSQIITTLILEKEIQKIINRKRYST